MPNQIRVYESDFLAYKANSPKHEIYLDNGEMIMFRLTEDAQDGQLWIGLSAPDAGKNSGTVAITTDHTETVQVTSGVDMYYPINLGESATVTIANGSSSLISVTNLKITGVEKIYNTAISTGAKSRNVGYSVEELADVMPMVFEPVTMQTVRMAANGGVDPEEPEVIEPEDPSEPDPTPTPTPTPEPTPEPSPEVPDDPEPSANPSILEMLQQLVSSFVSKLFGSISRLFGN